MNLKKKVADLAIFSFLETASVRAIRLLSSLIIIKFLPREELGIVGLSFGYLALLSVLFFAPETFLYRDYPAIRRQKKEALYVSSFLLFGLVRILVVAVVSCVVGGYIYWIYESAITLVSFLTIAMGASVLLIQGPVKELLRVDFKQRLSTVVGFLIEIVILSAFVLSLYFSPCLNTYLAVYLCTSIGTAIIWLIILKRIYKFPWIVSKGSIKILKESIKSFSLWNHINGAITNLMYNVDTAVLSMCGIPLAIIGNYTVALRLSNIFFLIPMILQSTNTIALSNVDRPKANSTLNIFFKYGLIVNLGQLLLFVVFGKWIIGLFVEGGDNEFVFRYAILIIIGISVLNFVRPLISWVAIEGQLKEAFLQAYLPAGMTSLAVYWLLTVSFGADGTALGNIVAYSLFSVLLIIYVIRKCPVRIKISWLTRQEKSLFSSWLRLKNKEAAEYEST